MVYVIQVKKNTQAPTVCVIQVTRVAIAIQSFVTNITFASMVAHVCPDLQKPTADAALDLLVITVKQKFAHHTNAKTMAHVTTEQLFSTRLDENAEKASRDHIVSLSTAQSTTIHANMALYVRMDTRRIRTCRASVLPFTLAVIALT